MMKKVIKTVYRLDQSEYNNLSITSKDCCLKYSNAPQTPSEELLLANLLSCFWECRDHKEEFKWKDFKNQFGNKYALSPIFTELFIEDWEECCSSHPKQGKLFFCIENNRIELEVSIPVNLV